MAEANLPVRRSPETLTDGQLSGLIDAIADGQHPSVIAKRLAKGDKRAQRRIQRRLERIILTDPAIAQGVASQARVHALVGLGPALSRLARRARSGHYQSIRLLLEITGYHNPRVSHEHHGEIKISVDIPRPVFEDGSEAPVVDAEVVE